MRRSKKKAIRRREDAFYRWLDGGTGLAHRHEPSTGDGFPSVGSISIGDSAIQAAPTTAPRAITFTTASATPRYHGEVHIEGIGASGEPLSEVLRLGAPGVQVLSENSYSSYRFKELLLPTKDNSSTAPISFGYVSLHERAR